MPGRSLPDWLLNLLTGTLRVNRVSSIISDEMSNLLALVKSGVRSKRSIAIRLGVDHGYAIGLIAHAAGLGLLTPQIRLTADGLDRLIQSSKRLTIPDWDRSLYIPSSWCAGRATVQPLTEEGFGSRRLADSVEVSASTDGDVGQTSLEGPDAKAATPPFGVAPQLPSSSRMRRDTDGPMGSKKR